MSLAKISIEIISDRIKIRSGKSKNLKDFDNPLEIISDDDEGDIHTLNLINQKLTSIPPDVALNKARFTTTLILTNNKLKSLKNLKFFTYLFSLQLDRNKLKHINDLPLLPKLTTLWLNNNRLKDLNKLLSILRKNTPELEDLSLLLNPLCPSLRLGTGNHEAYRLKVIRTFPRLKYLDTEPVTDEERQQAEANKALDYVSNSTITGHPSDSEPSKSIPSMTSMSKSMSNLKQYCDSPISKSITISSISTTMLQPMSPITPMPVTPMSPFTPPMSPLTPISPYTQSQPNTPTLKPLKSPCIKPKKKTSKTKEWMKDKLIKYMLNGEEFKLYNYYKPQKIIGSGAYGIVCSAIDERTGKKVAIKKNKYVFNDIIDARNTLREMKLLSYFTHYKHVDIIEIYDCITPKADAINTFAHIYVIMPLYDTTLLDIINSEQKLTHSHFQYILYQILRGLKFIHKSNVIHRDIKPENILINGNDCDVKIIDFGTSRGVNMQNNVFDKEITEYVCTRWYRAPEVMCNGGKYDNAMDIWSVGCILAEMILKKPLFPGDNYMDQLSYIFTTLKGSTDWILNNQAKQWINNKRKTIKKENIKTLSDLIFESKQFLNTNNTNKLLNNQCTDLLYKLLSLNPSNRISAEDALKHPYFKKYFEIDHNNMGINLVYNDNNGHKPFDLSYEFEKCITTPFGLRHKMQYELKKIHEKRWKKIIKKKYRKSSTYKFKKSKSERIKKRSKTTFSHKQYER